MHRVWLGFSVMLDLNTRLCNVCHMQYALIKLWESIWFPNLCQEFYDPLMYKNISENQTSVNCFVKTVFVWTLWEYVEKVVWVMRSSGNVCYLAHFFIGFKEIKKNLYLETFLVHSELSIKGVM